MINFKSFTLLLLVIISTINIVFAQKKNVQDLRQAEIRRLENVEKDAVMRGDSAVLFNNLWSPEMIVNTPANRIGTVEGTKMQLRSGKLKYLSFDRNIEKITFNDNLAIVMGEEKIKPQGDQDNAGKLVTRRFTNVWKYKNKVWSIIARQATIIKIE